MIFTRLRARVGVYVSAIFLLAGVALTAHATQAVAESQMRAYVLTAIGGAGAVVFGAFWILLVTISGRSEKAVAASIGRLEAAVASFAKALADHDGSAFAHRAASEHNHKPLEDQIAAMKEEFEDFVRWCREHQCPALPRDPGSSPHPKRATDSGDDYTPLRGHR